MREPERLVCAAAVAAVAAMHFAFLRGTSSVWWGLDILACCRWWHVAILACLAAGSLSLLHPSVMAAVDGRLSRIGARRRRPGLLKLHAGIFAAALAGLLLLGTTYHGGDAHWLSQMMPTFLKRAPLSSAVLVAGTRLGMAQGGSYVASLQATIAVVGALVVCGLFQLYLGVFGDARRAAGFLAASLASYGISRLLPGYIEVYGVYLLFLVIFHIALVRYCLTGKGFVLVLAALLLLVLAHIQALVVVPGTLIVTAAVQWQRKRRWQAAAGWVGLGLVLALLYPLLRHGGQSFSLLRAVGALAGARGDESGFWSVGEGSHLLAPVGVLLSGRHWLDVANIHVLVSAVGIALALAGLIAWRRGAEPDWLLRVAILNALAFGAGTAVFANFHHPIARDWDMFGPGALFALTLAAALWRRLPAERLRRTLLIVLPVTACIAALWLAQQAGILGVAPPPDIRIAYTTPEPAR